MSSVRKFPLMAELQTLFCFSSSSSFFCLGWGSKAIKLSTCLDLRLLTSNYITASNKYMMAAAALMFLKCQALLSSICNWFALAWTEVSQVWWMDLLREVLEHPVRFRNWTTFFQLLLGTSDPIATVACVCVSHVESSARLSYCYYDTWPQPYLISPKKACRLFEREPFNWTLSSLISILPCIVSLKSGRNHSVVSHRSNKFKVRQGGSILFSKIELQNIRGSVRLLVQCIYSVCVLSHHLHTFERWSSKSGTESQKFRCKMQLLWTQRKWRKERNEDISRKVAWTTNWRISVMSET